jgi:hypothetical protein
MQEVFNVVFNIHISEGGIHCLLHRFSDKTKPIYEIIKQRVCNSTVIGADFSNASKKCLSFAESIQSKQNFNLETVHVYSLPIHFSHYVSDSKIEPKLSRYVDKRFDQFLNKMNYSGEVKQYKILGREANIVFKLKNEAYKNDVDLLMVADKGSNTFSKLSLGSITEDLFNRYLKIPLLIVKDYIGN